jgi:hypothetical protein
VARRGWSHREVLGSIPSPCGHIYFATPPVRSAAGPACQVGRWTRPSGRPRDPPVRSWTRMPGRIWLSGPWHQPVSSWDPPARSIACGTRLWNLLSGSVGGTWLSDWLVGPDYQVGWWNRAVRLKFTNLNGHIDMTHRRIAEVSV